jgi:serine/threonine protein kinase/tetratricopeptide (TPR) repeat protein
MDLSGTTILHYQIGRKLGGGGMGVVYRARDIRLDRWVAIKFLSEELATSPQAVERFRREARATSALHHPNICTIFDIGETEGHHFLVMELMEGQTLIQRMAGGPLPIDEVISIGIQVASALEAAHAKRIVHRDLKPTNIFVTNQGEAKVLDFGLAKLLPERRKRPRQPSATGLPRTALAPALLTSPGMVMGTIAYMSPEQARGEQVDHRTDLFSFGVVLYEMTTGYPAFPGDSSAVIFDGLLNRNPAAPSALNPNVPHELDMIVYKALEKDRTLRYQSASDLRTDLLRLRRIADSGRFVPASGPVPYPTMVGRPSPSTPVSATVVGRPSPSVPVAATVVTPPPGMATPFPSAGTPPADAMQEEARSAFLERIKRIPRPQAAAAAVILALLAALALGWRIFQPAYSPAIVVGEFPAESESVPPGLVEFALRRSLGQLPGVTVMEAREFSRAQELEQGRKAQALKHERGWLDYLSLERFRSQAPSRPALMVSGRVRESVSGLELQVDYERRGDRGSFVVPFNSSEVLLSSAIDLLAQRVLALYNSGGATGPAEVRPAVQLLTQYWDALRHYWRGVQAWNRLEIGLADREIVSALQIDPSFALARVTLAELRAFQERWDEARNEILAAQKSTAGLTETDRLRIEALLARVSSQPFEERKHLQKLIGLQPYKREYTFELAESYFHTGDVEEAILKYRDALKLDDRYALAYNHLGYCYAWKGDHANALAALRRYLEIDKSPNAYDSLGDVYMHAGDYANALEMKRRALEGDPSLYYAKRGMAFISILQGRLADAEKQLQAEMTAATDDNTKADLSSALAYLRYRQGDFAAARRVCEQGLTLVAGSVYDDRVVELTWLKGMADLETRNLPSARAALARLERAIAAKGINETNFKPMYKFALLLRIRLLAENGKPDDVEKAVSDLSWVKDKLGYWATPYDRAFSFDVAGRALEKVGRISPAEDAYRNALIYNPHFPLAHFHLASLLLNKGDRAGVREHLQAALSSWKDADANLPEYLAAHQMLEKL